jgi:hypothetical protein
MDENARSNRQHRCKSYRNTTLQFLKHWMDHANPQAAIDEQHNPEQKGNGVFCQ